MSDSIVVRVACLLGCLLAFLFVRSFVRSIHSFGGSTDRPTTDGVYSLWSRFVGFLPPFPSFPLEGRAIGFSGCVLVVVVVVVVVFIVRLSSSSSSSSSSSFLMLLEWSLT